MIKTPYFKNKKLQVLHVNFEENDSISFYAIQFEKENTQLNIGKKSSYTNIEEVIANLNKKTSLLIHFSGKGIVHKKVVQTKSSISGLIFNQNFEDFYFFEYIDDNDSFVSFVRKKLIDNVLIELKDAKLFCLDFSIGPFISTILTSEVSILYSDDFELLMDQNALVGFKKVATDFKSQLNTFGDLTLNTQETPLFATAIHYFFKSSKIKMTESSILLSNKEESMYYKLFSISGSFILIFFLTSLFISYFLLNNYNQEYIELQSKMIYFQDSYYKTGSLKQSILDKEEILYTSGVYNEHYLSFYINEITQLLPTKIILSDITVFPINSTIKKGKKIVVNSQHILIEGKTISSNDFNEWLKILKKEKWIKKIEIIIYKKDKIDAFKLMLYV